MLTEVCEPNSPTRRARDRLLAGEPPAHARSSELDNLLYLVGDDLREACDAMGGIELFLVRISKLLGRPEACSTGLSAVLRTSDIGDRVEQLEVSLSSLVHGLRRILDHQPRD